MTTGPLIHIGYHRTATTWFQDRFYPAVENATYVPRGIVRKALIEPNAFSFSPAAARDQLAAFAPSRRLLLCEENLSGYVHNGGLGGLLSKEVAHRLKQSFPDATILVFIRSQPRIIAAAYAQYVKGGGTYPPERYINAQGHRGGATKYWYKAPLFSLDHFEYGPLLRHYESLFGRDSVAVQLYEQFAEDPHMFLTRMVSAFSLEIDLNGIDMSPVNASMSPRQMEIMRRLNMLTRRSVIDKWTFWDVKNWYQNRWKWLARIKGIIDGISPSNDKRPLFSKKLRSTIDARYRESNARLALDWNLPLRQYGYPMPDQPGSDENHDSDAGMRR